MKPATGKLGVMTVGLGAVSTTFITGVLMARKGLAKPIGALTQYDKIRVGHGVEKKYLPMGEIISEMDKASSLFQHQAQKVALPYSTRFLRARVRAYRAYTIISRFLPSLPSPPTEKHLTTA